MVDDEIKILRQVRHDISAEFGHDVDRVVDYYRSVEEELKRSGRYRFATHGAGPEPMDAEERRLGSSTVASDSTAAF